MFLKIICYNNNSWQNYAWVIATEAMLHSLLMRHLTFLPLSLKKNRMSSSIQGYTEIKTVLKKKDFLFSTWTCRNKKLDSLEAAEKMSTVLTSNWDPPLVVIPKHEEFDWVLMTNVESTQDWLMGITWFEKLTMCWIVFVSILVSKPNKTVTYDPTGSFTCNLMYVHKIPIKQYPIH